MTTVKQYDRLNRLESTRSTGIEPRAPKLPIATAWYSGAACARMAQGVA
jgi:hypothetical protein